MADKVWWRLFFLALFCSLSKMPLICGMLHVAAKGKGCHVVANTLAVKWVGEDVTERHAIPVLAR